MAWTSNMMNDWEWWTIIQYISDEVKLKFEVPRAIAWRVASCDDIKRVWFNDEILRGKTICIAQDDLDCTKYSEYFCIIYFHGGVGAEKKTYEVTFVIS